MGKLKLWVAQETHNIMGTAQQVDFSAKSTIHSLLPSFDSALGYTVEDIRQRSKLMDRLDEAAEDGEIEITKEMAELLIKRLEHYRVTVPSINLVKLEEQLKQCQ